MRTILVAGLFAGILAGCGGLKQINLKTAAGGEIRGHADTDYRTSVGAGPEFQFQNGVKTTVFYRNRLTDLQADTMEHGIFVGASIPIWRK